MKKILFPTDFSPAADAAFAYAMHLADHLDAHIYGLHAYSLTHSADWLAPPDLIDSLQSDEEQRAMEKMQEYHARILAEGQKDIPFHPLLRVGFASDVLEKACQELKPDLVVMGTKGATNSLDRFLGSITSQVISRIDVPVLAIPANTVYSSIDRIVYAADYRERDTESIKRLGKIAYNLGAQIDLVHVQHPDEEAFSAELKQQIREMYQAETGQEHLQIHEIQNESAADGLATFVEQRATDLLAVSTHKRGFFESLFHRSVTRRLALYAAKPLLVFHSE